MNMKILVRYLLVGALAAGWAVGSGAEESASGLPERRGSPGAPLTASERQAFLGWVLTQPKVLSLLADHRYRVLKQGSEVSKLEGGEVRFGVLLIRDYDARKTHQVRVDLASGTLAIESWERRGQPNQEEIAEAMSIIRRDPALKSLVDNPSLGLDGGFYVPSTDPQDPCYLDVCMQFGFMKPRFERPPARIVVVDLQRQAVVNHDYKSALDAGHPERMTERQEAGQ